MPDLWNSKRSCNMVFGITLRLQGIHWIVYSFIPYTWTLGDIPELISGKCIFQTLVETRVGKPHGIPPKLWWCWKLAKKAWTALHYFPN